jgi:hypothetical protein
MIVVTDRINAMENLFFQMKFVRADLKIFIRQIITFAAMGNTLILKKEQELSLDLYAVNVIQSYLKEFLTTMMVPMQTDILHYGF